ISLISATWRKDLGELPVASGAWTSHMARANEGQSIGKAETVSAEQLTDWEKWHLESAEAHAAVAGDTLKIAWTGQPGLYLLRSPTVTIPRGETLLVPFTASVQ